jgi:L-threonylcarbamoyladenylate synthase
VALLPTDTVYGLACDPENPAAVRRLYELKGRPPERPAAVMFFSLAGALEALDWLADAERGALDALLPGPVTVLLPNPAQRFPLACIGASTLGLRVPCLPARIGALAGLATPVMQSSANLTGGPEARRLDEVDGHVRAGLDLELDGGELPGVASTVLDLGAYGTDGSWRLVREGPLGPAEITRLLA